MNISLDESTTEAIPTLLHEMINKVTVESKTFDSAQKDFLFILIVVSMIENGFCLSNNELEVINPMEAFNIDLLSKWKSRTGTYQATFTLTGFKTVAKVIMSPLGATVLVNLVIPELDSETYSACIPVSRYVVSPQATTIPMIFRNLKQFSDVMKNSIITPAKSKILNYHGYASASLIGLPEEVLLNIMLNLPINSVLNLCKTCTKLRGVLDNESLWHSLCKRDFCKDLQPDEQYWKEFYKQKYLQQIKRSTSLANRPIQDLRHYSNSVYSIHNPMWNII